jgi:predicted nucleic acid-binding protein
VLVVADAGPLIFLSAIAQLELLRALHDRVLIPMAVFEEVVESGAGQPGCTEVAQAKWLEIHKVDEADPILRTLLTTLDAGEAAALALPHREGADLVLMDERRGRAAARRLGLAVQGTLGLLVRAKRNGAIETVGPHLRSLREAGFWISSEVLDRTLEAAGEAMPPN